MEKSYITAAIKKESIVTVEKLENVKLKYAIDIESDNQIVRLYFEDLKSLCEIMFFEIAEKIQPYIRNGEM